MILRDISYDEAKELYDKLSDKEKSYVAPRGKYIDSPKLSFRLGLVEKNNLLGFIDVYEFNEKEGFIIIAVDPYYRGMGVAKSLLKSAIIVAISKNFNKLIYKVDKSNKASVNFINNSVYNFILTSESYNDLTYTLQLNS